MRLSVMTTAPRAKKPKRIEMPPDSGRERGSTVYTKRTTDRAYAARLVAECEFRVMSDGPDGIVLHADGEAYLKYKALPDSAGA